jgi:hypothetical protein
VDGATCFAHCAACHGQAGRGDGPQATVFVRRPRSLREGFLARYPTDELVARIRSGSQLDLTLDPPALGRALDDIDAVAAHLRRLPEVDWPRWREGRGLFLVRCEAATVRWARGDGGQPLEKVPPDLGAAAARAGRERRA